jgi:uncharacterized protein YceH (UPF0502 family)
VELSQEFTAVEQRVLGCLIEKGATTPEHYPLTMNALIAACNQTSNRDPIVSYQEDEVTAALTWLRERKLIRIVYPAHARVTKYRHVLDEVWALSPQEAAVLAVLLLRGGQTQNELATRTERYEGAGPADLDDLGGVAGVLDRMARRPEPLARLAERRPGHREDRYIHLLGPIEFAEISDISVTKGSSTTERILALETETANLRRDLARMREWLGEVLGESIPPSESLPG